MRSLLAVGLAAIASACSGASAGGSSGAGAAGGSTGSLTGGAGSTGGGGLATSGSTGRLAASGSIGSTSAGSRSTGGGTTDAVSSAGGSSSGAATTGGSATSALVPGCPIFSPSDPYNQPVDSLPLDPTSAARMAFVSEPDGGADFAACSNFDGFQLGWGDLYYLNVVPASQPLVAVDVIDGYSQLSGWTPDGGFSQQLPAQLPIPAGALVEDPGAHATSGDRHLLIAQRGVCLDYELYSAHVTDAGWQAYNAFRWDLAGDDRPPDDHGSVTAAGTHLLTGVVWAAEVDAGAIDHAVDLTGPVMTTSQLGFIHPATEGSGICVSSPSPEALAYGARLRLKASYPEAGLGPQAKVIVAALKRYGVIYTDVGCCYSLRVEHSSFWSAADVAQITQISMSDFELPQQGTRLMDSAACIPNAGCQ